MADPAHTLVPVASLREYLGITEEDEAETSRALLCLEAAKQTLERFTGRRFSTMTETRFFDVAYETTEMVVGDFQSVSEVATRGRHSQDYTILAAGDYTLRKDDPERPYRRIRRTSGYFYQGDDNLRVSGVWGMTLPTDLELGILMETAHLFQSNQSPGGEYLGADGSLVEDISARNPAFFSVMDNWRVGVWA